MYVYRTNTGVIQSENYKDAAQRTGHKVFQVKTGQNLPKRKRTTRLDFDRLRESCYGLVLHFWHGKIVQDKMEAVERPDSAKVGFALCLFSGEIVFPE